ncbi:DUF397 domain-containing protein [Streptomyces sp. TRM68416]|uniref:DUF397 domain-containing protein n=1 Tax=Streptomyces sp. TRM68416 TaxID=2758412 RepID=UPI001661F022|nr:DUF397 domain-containing protein [Streptomyces sp. TRM68416]MBD0841870.1 DUF397 domain-containing protein [Streptomyces sp. TRM68416]
MTSAEPSGLHGPTWFTSSYSNGAGGECVECAYVTGGTLIRDSKSPEGPSLTVGTQAWRRFLGALSHGGPERVL